MKILTLSVLAVALCFTAGCTTHLVEGQKQELSIYESKGLAVKEKSVGAAAVLGLLPGMGYFYTGHPVLGVTTIPLYLISLGPLWMPFDTAAAAESRNYYSTKIQVERDKAQALRELDHKLEDKKLSYEQHLREQRLIEAKFSAY